MSIILTGDPLTIDDVVDDSIVREIETGGFIERIYR